MKKPKAKVEKTKLNKPDKTLPADFSSSDIQGVKDSLPKPVPPAVTAQTPQPEPVSTAIPAVPSVDVNANLKFESAPIEEDLPAQEKRGKLLFVIGTILGVLIIAGVITLGILYYNIPDNKAEVPTPTLTPTPQITEAPATAVKNADITFEVLNGSGVSGQAAKYGKQLETLGYQVNLLDNAEGTHTGLSIYITQNLQTQKDTLMTDLKKEFPSATYAGVLTDSTNMVRVIIGK